MNKRVAFLTLGCKVNAYETDAMERLFRNEGYTVVKFNEIADVYVINTCSVTNMADKKSRQMIHRAKRNNYNSIVVATGCYVQTSTVEASNDDAVDLLIGNNKKNEIVGIIEEYIKKLSNNKNDIWSSQEIVNVIDINNKIQYEEMNIDKTGEKTRAYIKIQDGCNQFCSYCIIPYARGRIRSRDMENIINEVNVLADNGYKEVVLTGIHLSSYGLDFCEKRSNGFRYEFLLEVISKISSINGIERIRLGSLEPRIITEEFIKELSKISEVCPHFHLSLQSGCDETLKRMNRKYTTKEYREKCEIIRHYYSNPSITTDVIVGFPGETEEEFLMTKEFLEEISLSQMHIFKYSIRKGTVAASMKKQVSESVKSSRSKILFELDRKNQNCYENSFIGQTQKVLFEEVVDIDGERYIVGHNERYVKIAIKCEEYEEFKNNIVSVLIKNRISDDILVGEVIK